MSLLAATYHSSLSQLADASDATFLSSSATNSTGLTETDVPLAVTGTITGSAGSGVISHVVFEVRARAVLGGASTLSEATVTWTLGGSEDHELVGLTGAFATYMTHDVVVDPTGAAWTWAHVAALTGVGLACLATIPPGQTADVDVAMARVLVYGSSGGTDAVALLGVLDVAEVSA